MRWEYKRILIPSGVNVGAGRYTGQSPESWSTRELFEKKAPIANARVLQRAAEEGTRYDHLGEVNFPHVEDCVERRLNALGAEGWEVAAVTRIRHTHDGLLREPPLVEYLLKRPAAQG